MSYSLAKVQIDYQKMENLQYDYFNRKRASADKIIIL